MARAGGRAGPSTEMLVSAALATATLVLMALAAWMRLYHLGVPFDRDSYDEGVYWQTLRAMAAGHGLYSPIFFSQPPAFMLSIFPFYMMFGQTIWAARLAIVVISMIGVVGAYLLGRAFGGRLGGFVAVLLLFSDPYYLKMSRTLQAEGVAVPLSLMAVALAYVWWEKPSGRAGRTLAVLAGATLSLSVMSKLLTVAAVVPIGLLVGGHLLRLHRRGQLAGTPQSRSLLAGLGAVTMASLLQIAPFAGDLGSLWQGVVEFHLRAAELYKSSQSENLADIMDFLRGSPTAYAALCGVVAASLRKDGRVLPLIAWLVATLYILWAQVPMFPHHLVAFTPVLVSLAVAGIGPVKFTGKSTSMPAALGGAIVLLSAMLASIQDWQAASRYLLAETLQANTDGEEWMRVADDLREAIGPTDLVITDSQFIAGLADRGVPPGLVDTSSVRITTGYLSVEQLVEEVSSPEVKAVLFYSGRLTRGEVAMFAQLVREQFYLLRSYGDRKELWVKPGSRQGHQELGQGRSR